MASLKGTPYTSVIDEEDLALEINFDPSSNGIDLTLYEQPSPSTSKAKVPLTLAYKYSPSTGYAPIHEVPTSRNASIKKHYWALWGFGDDWNTLGIEDEFQGDEVEVKGDEVEDFCRVVGNDSDMYRRGKGKEVSVPMDFAIKLGWKSIMKAIFPPAIDGDLLRLVHLSNGFKRIPSAPELRIGDRVTSVSRITSVTNSESGKTVKVSGTVFLLSSDGKKVPVMEVESAFFYRGRFNDYDSTFEKVKEDDYRVTLKTQQDIAILKSKQWFETLDDRYQLVQGLELTFKTESQYTFKNKSTYASVKVSGSAYVYDSNRNLTRVATVDYDSFGPTKGNPVTEFFKRHGNQLDQPILFTSGGYSLTPAPTADSAASFTTPSSNQAYSSISGDCNPIHTNPYFADLADLPATITHGMRTSASTRRFVESYVANNVPSRVVSFTANFTSMVVPNSHLAVSLSHIGQHRGNKLIKVTTIDTETGVKVLEGQAEVAQKTTAYVFTGQGSQEQGMGMELYNNSEVAKKVWDEADRHLGDVYGFSIIEIVKNNPKELTVHFGGLKGQTIRQRYIDMTYTTAGKDEILETKPLFPDIDLRSSRYTFSSPTGLLFATQFAQIALVMMEKAAFEDMKARGLIQEDCAFAGHSLGEYSALASIANVLPISALVDVVFFRGITMQRAVERDSLNRSAYGMMAVNPSRIGKSFTEQALKEVVDSISRRADVLLELVNYNVEGQQYVAAGELVALQCLTNVLNFLKIQKIDLKKLTETMTLDEVKEHLNQIVDECWKSAKELQEKEGFIKLERGFATIPLPGIDVPFHSRYLWNGVLPFRTYLSKKINPEHLRPELLVGRYIPNLTAEPFDISKEYAERIYNQTASPRLDKVLKGWERDNWADPKNRVKLGYTILVELLAYQFASPVRWIETQDRLFSEFNFERLIEFGPGPTLTGMANRTLKIKYESSDDARGIQREILCYTKNSKEIYFEFEDEAAAAPEPAAASAAAAAAAAAPSPSSVPAAAAPVAAAAPAPSGPAAQVEDVPLKAVDVLRVIIATKLKKPVSEVPLSKPIKDLVGGKSTLQNEILGDLQGEFGSAPDKGEELPLDELGAALQVGFSGNLGKYTNGLVSRLVGGKMPGGFAISAVKGHLQKTWGLGPGRTEGALLFGLTMEPPKRLGEPEAKAWLDSVAQAYAQQAGISLSSGGGGGGGGGGAGVAMMNPEIFEKFSAKQDEFVGQQVEVLLRYLNRDSRSGHRLFDAAKVEANSLQDRLDAINREHGDLYIQGIQPVFDPLKARHFDSAFNWVRQDALSMFFDMIFGRLTTVDRVITARCLVIMNRADPQLLDYMRYHLDRVDPSRGPGYKLVKEFGKLLMENCSEVVGHSPLYKDVTYPTAPKTTISEKGDIIYEEVQRPRVSKLEKYVVEMAAGSPISSSVNLEKVHDSIQNLYRLVKSQPHNKQYMSQIRSLYGEVVKSLGRDGQSRRTPPRSRRPSSQFLRPMLREPTALGDDKVPLLHLKRKVGTNWQYSSKLTTLYLDVLKEIATSGTSFEHKNALLTGVGKGSIGVEILRGLLAGGARVVVTTSRYSRATVEYYQAIYQEVGSRGSSLTVVPFNQGSKQDVEALVDYIYSTEGGAKGLGMDLDYILPFAAIPENGREVDGIDDKSELAHRVMLVNLIRLLGAVKTKKASRRFITRPTQVVLPLSPNHGTMGGDGLYSESKISLETLFNRWSSEGWGEYLCIAGAVIGWTRGTGLMDATNIVAEGVEKLGVRTFSAKEMAFNILGLMHPLLMDVSQIEPVWADLNGGMDKLEDLSAVTTKIRTELRAVADTRRAVSIDSSLDFKITGGNEAEALHTKVNIAPRANFTVPFPKLRQFDAASELAKLKGIIDYDKVVVVTGFAEVGPFGSARTRWEMESRGKFTIEGTLELAFIMGMIKHFDGRLKNGQNYVGWIDAKTQEPVEDKDVKAQYEKLILEHTGVRLIESELFNGYDPKRKGFMQEIELNHDLEPIETSGADADKFKLQHGEFVDVWNDGERFFVKFRKGCKMLVPKAMRFDRLVAGQIPTGWDPKAFGIPDDIVAQVDRTSLWALVAVADALVMAGITDPYELYKYVHPSEVGTALGSGLGGVTSLTKMFRDRREERDVQNDVLQETFINTVAGWVQLLLLSSSGPIKIPVGACATALQSVDISIDTIVTGKAKVMIAGGYDDFSEEGSYEFAQMKATSSTETEFAAGREPNEMSRPTTSTRAGFMESQGCGVQILMSASTAIKMGAPIYGIVAYTATATDKAGRSIPAPGRGVLSTARQLQSPTSSHILEVSYRRRQVEFRRRQVSQWLDNEMTLLNDELESRRTSGEPVSEEEAAERVRMIESEARRQETDALATFGMLEGQDPTIAPLRRGLAVWGLTIDDIGVVSFHGTSTKANDKNESNVFNNQFGHLGRSKGNACPVIAQKWLTGHPKGAAAAWMMNGLTQSLLEGLIPGNRNADNIAPEMQSFEYLVYPSRSIQTDGIKAGLLKSFGFGQVGGECLIVHPDYLLASLEDAAYGEYQSKNAARFRQAYRRFNDAFVLSNLVQPKDSPPYEPEIEGPVLLNPLARAEKDAHGSYSFPKKLPSTTLRNGYNEIGKQLARATTGVHGVGTDIEIISSVPSDNANFLERNFTEGEIAYCRSSSDFKSSLAGRWVAKEAVFKSLKTTSQGAAAPLKDIEIVASSTGAPTVLLHGQAAKVAEELGVRSFELSISHADESAVAIALAKN